MQRLLESRLFQNKLFRYFISAGLATWVDITVYFLAYNYLYQKSDIGVFNVYTISAATASLFLSYTMGLLTNFLITRYLVFNDSELEFHKQLFRYVLVAMLVHVAAYRVGFEFWGVQAPDLRTVMARIVYWSITGVKPPA